MDLRPKARYRFALQLASLEPPEPEFAEFLSAVAADPDKTRRFLGLLAGTTAFDDVFGPVPAQQGNPEPPAQP